VGFRSHRDPLVAQEIGGGDRAAIACRQCNRSFVLRQRDADADRLLVSRCSKDGRRPDVGVQPKDPRRLGVEENTRAVSDASRDQVAIESLSEKAAKICQSLGRAVWELILHEESVPARWLPRWRAMCPCNSYA